MNKTLTKVIVIMAVFGVSLSAIFGKIVTAPSLVSAMYRMVFTSLLLLPVILARYREELARTGIRNVAMCLLSGVFLGFHFASYLESLKYTTIASSTVLVDLEVLFVALMMFFLFRERIPRLALAGIAVTLIGSFIIAMGDSSGGSNIIYGDMMALLGAFCTSVYTMIGRAQRQHLSTTAYTFLVYLSASVTLGIAVALTGTQAVGYPVTDYLSFLGMAVCCTLLGHSIFSWALRYISPAFVSTAKLLEPVFATIMGILLFSEIPRVNQVIGGVIVIGGILIYMFTKEDGD